MAELDGSESGNSNPDGKIIDFPENRRRRIVFPSASEDVRGLVFAPEQTRDIVTPEEKNQIPQFPPAELILSDEKEAQVEEIKKTFGRPTKEGIKKMVDELKNSGEDMPDDVSGAMAEWFNRSWWTWYEGDERNPFDYKDYFDSNNPMEREHAVNAMIQEVLIRKSVRGGEMLEGEEILIKGLLQYAGEAWATAEQIYDFKSRRPDSDTNSEDFFKNPYTENSENKNNALSEASKKAKDQFRLLSEKGAPVIDLFINKYVGMDTSARREIKDTGSFPPREVAVSA